MIGKWLAKRQKTKRVKAEQKLISASKRLDISTVDTLVCLAGPYRNLTTLTASIAALHPNCQVLNHAQERILPHQEVDFFSNYSLERWAQFLQYALTLSIGGERGRNGGSILHSHAFDYGKVKKLYRNRYGNALMKERVVSVLWKEGLYLSNHLKKHNISPLQLIKKQAKLKFVLPIRNVLDCAVSNKKTTLAYIFNDIDQNSSMEEIVSAILDEYVMFFKNQKENPSHFFHFFEHSFDKETLVAFCHFAKIQFDKQWAEEVLSIFEMKSSYEHSDKLLQHYKAIVLEKFEGFPEIKAKLLAFCN